MAQESGVSQHAVHFKGEADRHEATAKQWLSATIWLAAVTLAFAIAFFVLYFTIGSTLTATQNLQLAISKVIIIFILLSATFWVGRTYRAHRHNAVVNRHRQNALTTFRTFVEATGDEPTKNAVLLQATQCIFSPQQTGYVSSESEPGIPQVLEIVRTLGKSSG
ncbi:MAG: hypothetical protein LAO04_15645 [Acidobacteriia bacterium]|nr:hypothetical protein [Terriglobia bacterium]